MANEIDTIGDGQQPSADAPENALATLAGERTMPDGPAPEAIPFVELRNQLMDRIKSRNVAQDLIDASKREKIAEIGQTVKREYDIDENSRSDWKSRTEEADRVARQVATEKTYPWPKASNVIFPLMTSAALQFAARAYPAIVAGRNVVKGEVIGEDNGVPLIDPKTGQPVMGPNGPQWQVQPGAKLDRARRIGHHMSWQLIDEQSEWEPDTDSMLHQLPIVGCCFRKSYFDPELGRNVSLMVPAMKLCINYKAKSVELAPRQTEIIEKYPYQIREAVMAGTYIDHSYGLPTDSQGDTDAPHIFLEQHRRIDLDDDGYPEPYIVTIHRESAQVARIKADFDEDTIFFRNARMPDRLFTLEDLNSPLAQQLGLGDDVWADMALAKIKPVTYYTQYDFLPSLDGGIYGTGFGNLLKPINDAINTSLNQLIDAGHLANTGGGFIGKGLSMTAGAVRFSLGEYKTVNVAGGNLRDNIVPMPFPGPNATLFQLLGMLIEAGKEVAAIKDVLSGDVAAQTAQPTTVMALIEQGLKVFVAIYKRIWRGLKAEYQKLYRLNRLYMPKEGVWFMRGDQQFRVTLADYANDMAVLPVSDPSQVTDMQRMSRAAFLLTFKDDPLINKAKIYQRAFDAAQIEKPEELLLSPPPPDPVMMAEKQKIQMRAVELGSAARKDRAEELRAFAQAILFLAQAKKAEQGATLEWLEHQAEMLQRHWDITTQLWEAGGLPGGLQPPGGDEGEAGAGAGAPTGAGAPA